MWYLGFTKLRVWKEAYDLTLRIYQISNDFPINERFALKSQIRRSAASTATNLAEGAGRLSMGDKRRFFDIALGSANETAMHLMLARDLSYLDADTSNELIQKYAGLSAGINAMINRLNYQK